jgi:glutamine---fructose-6-phosphate transaminase (isomerizing)
MTNMWNEIMEQPSVLKKCLSNNEDTLNRIVNEIKERKPEFVIIAARGTSDHAAVYAKYMFETLTGLPVVLAAPSVVTTYKSKLEMKNALVIGVSQSGEAKDVTAILDEAKRNNALTVSITNFENSLLATTSKYSLLCSAGVEKSVAATKTFTTQLILLGMLAAKLADHAEVQNLLKNAPEYVEKTIAMVKDQIKEVALRYRFIDECIILARGLNYAVALESALKIEETTYVRAKAFAASDFHHGPMAILQKDMPVIVYAPSGPSLNDMLEMISLLKEAQADVLIVSDDDSLCMLGNCHIKIPNVGSDFVSPFVNSVVAQMLACELASVKGLNPDAPRMLHKVTITV